MQTAVVRVLSLLFPVDEFCRIKFFLSLKMQKKVAEIKRIKSGRLPERFHHLVQNKTVPRHESLKTGCKRGRDLVGVGVADQSCDL